ncbi:PAS domain-containing protein [Glacieibacterium megasporae]|uniref:PAS domain-containing protein n=1 Tax=Glacieibacterium megasporae TaxID=2835787 RepID=UPI0021041961|nr:PAS domain-containing protein [Polymorphobacter megasporae]
MVANTSLTFNSISATDIGKLAPAECDLLPFGVIGLDAKGVAVIYNATEARLAGLRPENVIGAAFFESIAQCMNNYLVAQRFIDEAVIDETIPFVLTLRMRPTPVRLRLLATPEVPLNYILIER